MAFELEPVPAALIHQLQRSICLDSSLPTSSPPPPFIIPSVDDVLRCSRCGGGEAQELLGLCVYCGGVGSGGKCEISFWDTVGYGWLLGSLGLDASDPVTINSELTEPNKGGDTPKTSTVLLSDVLELKLRLSAMKTTNQIQNSIKDEPISLNLSGIDIDSIFKETKKEIPSNQAKPGAKSQNFVSTKLNTVNFAKAEPSQSFAKWDAFQPNFDSGNNNEANSSVTKIGNSDDSSDVSEHFKPNPMDKLTVSTSEASNRVENLSLEDDDFDDWNNFAGSAVVQIEEKNKSCSSDPLPVIIINRSENNIEVLGAERSSDDFDDWNNFAGSAENEEKNVASSSDDLPVISINRSDNNLEALNGEFDKQKDITGSQNELTDNKDTSNANNYDNSFDDWNAFTGSSVIPTRSISFDSLPVMTIEKSSDNSINLVTNSDDMFDDWKDFSGQSGLMGQAERPASVDPLSQQETALNAGFDDWKDLKVSDPAPSGLMGQNENIGPVTIDPLSQQEAALNADFDDWSVLTSSNVAQSGLTGQIENTGPVSVDPLNQQDALNAEFDDWNDFSGSNTTQSGLAGQEKTEPDPLNQQDALNAEFDDWNDFSGSNTTQSGLTGQEKTEPDPLNQQDVLNAEFDDWNDFSGSNTTQSGLTGQEKTEPDPLNQQGALNAEFDDWKVLRKSNVVQTIEPSEDLFDEWQDFATSSQITTEQNPKNDASSQITTEQNPKNDGSSQITTEQNPRKQDDDVASDDWSTSFDDGFQQALDASVDQSDEWLGLKRKTELMERLESKRKNGNLNKTDDWLDFTGSVKPNPNSIVNEKESKLSNDLFDDWKNFAGSSSEVKNAELRSKEENLDLDLDLDFWGSGIKKTELGSVSKGLSDDWIGSSTGLSQAKGNNSSELVGKNNDKSDDWVDLWNSSKKSEGTKLEGIKKEKNDGLNNWQDNIDSLNGRLERNGDSSSGLALSESKSGSELTNDAEKFLSQMNDLSFMLKDELSVPNKLDSK